MPKSKNRRKSKSLRKDGAATQTSLQTEVLEPAQDVKAERVEASGPKTSVSPMAFFRQVRSEMQKVTWTSRGETMVSTIMVLIMVTIMSLFFFAVDQLLRFVVPLILSLNFG